jgi:hypothetical protein
MRRVVLWLGIVLIAPTFAAFGANAGPSAGARAPDGTAEQVGKVNFPTSCAMPAQGTLDRGLALLHSFQYQEAEQVFTKATQQDPHCAMAYWGQAMGLYHQLWDFPSAQMLAKGLSDVQRAQKTGPVTPREREYIEAAAAFFQGDSKLTQTARVEAYSLPMKKLSDDNPADNEAGEFYALSLVSLAQMGVDDLANRKRAIAILDPIFAKYPDNPGAAHYLIHASDDPALAEQGLAAARAYAKIAPDSSHALHMPSHIFRRLGLWQEMIDSNLAAAAAAAKATEEHRGDASYQFHAMDFLDYAYLQSGQEAKARRLVDQVKSVLGASPANVIDRQDLLSATNALELQRWKDAATLEIPNEKLDWQDVAYWTRAIGAAHTGAVDEARASTAKLDEIIAARKARQHAQDSSPSAAADVMQAEAEAWLAYAEGKSADAVAKLRSAAQREESSHSDPFTVPAREMLADMLLLLKRPSEALPEYEAVLKDYPNRFDSLLGAARSADSADEKSAASRYYEKLISICPANADRPELKEAHAYMSAKRG